MRYAPLLALTAIIATLSGCASPPTGADVSNTDPARYSGDSALLILDSKPIVGKGRDDLLIDLEGVARAQLPEVLAKRAPARYPLPSKLPTFELHDPYAATYSGALVSLFSKHAKVPVCENTVMTLHGVTTDVRQTGERASLFACVMQYEAGYRTAIYVTYEKQSRVLSILLKKKESRIHGELFIPETLSALRAVVERNTANVKVVNPANAS